MNFALASAPRVAGIVHHFGEIEKVVQVIVLFVVANRFDYAPGYTLGASRRINPPIGADGKRPTGVRLRLA